MKDSNDQDDQIIETGDVTTLKIQLPQATTMQDYHNAQMKCVEYARQNLHPFYEKPTDEYKQQIVELMGALSFVQVIATQRATASSS